MKNLIIILTASIMFSNCSFAFDDSFDNIDFNFIDTAFDGIQPVTDKQFNDTINKLTPQPVEDTFGGKLKAFLFGRKYGVETPPAAKQQGTKIDIGGEKKAIEDIKNGVYYIKLLVSIVGNEGKIIPLGNYKIKEENINSEAMLVFYQGTQEYGKLKLRKFEDTKQKENEIAYSRVDIVSDNIVRIVYSTIKETKCATAKVYKP